MASNEPNQPTVPLPEEQQEEVVVVVTDVAPPQESAEAKEEEKEKEEDEPTTETKTVVSEEEEVTSNIKPESPTEITSESYDFPENEKKALLELKQLIQTALINHEFTTPPPPQPPQQPPQSMEETTTNDETKVTIDEDGTKTVEAIEESTTSTHQPLEELSIYGVPLFKDERTDTILWKFLRARDFKVNEALTMVKSTMKWRKEFKIDELLEEELGGEEFEKAVFMDGFSKEGNPVCYNVYGVFQDKELYEKTFSDDEKRERFLKWRIQFLEKSVRKLDFNHGGVCTIVQVNDLKNSPGPGKWELRQATKQALHLLQDNYPEFVAKQVFINVPWWYVAVNKMISPFLTQRTKSKFVVAGPSKTAETLFSYIAPEQVPVGYGGFNNKGEYGTKHGATQIIVKPTSKETVEFPVTEACELTWEVRVLGWEVSYGAEFVPNAKDAYTVIIQKISKVGPTQQSIISNTFKTSEPGKVVLTIDNSSSKKKTLLYRLKSNPSCEF